MPKNGPSHRSHANPLSSPTSHPAISAFRGATEVCLGDLSDPTMLLPSPYAKASSDAYPLYALSPVIAEAQAE